jgi:hypothetical protein
MVAAVVKTHKQLTKAKKEELEINEEQYTWSSIDLILFPQFNCVF